MLTTDELERGLQALQQPETDSSDFWTSNGPAFRETIRLAIRETSGALLHHEMSAALRAELECQLVWLENYLSPNPQKLN
ncbi:hypothetical protein G7076_10175 [Sphingomonas sp. HDW15A]|uniref:hypothetical protein n=1 Tax=Sphingomonas sp. HDW15A TaxID=2714942 RepID=UPI00140985FE|nr:hypothetical protein [Sphingomonas sp. HDW15A]QIK96753.1 hypothetical protein G7076_10175 [Sphingomonas sp. HDW15A]